MLISFCNSLHLKKTSENEEKESESYVAGL